ncbi:26S proteasome non-ATPase regulatory subunit 8, partial [Toxocara canis]
VVLTEGTIPSPYYAVFIRILMDTVRGEIATCIERAFKRVSLKDATQLLLFNNESETVPFTSKVCRSYRFFVVYLVMGILSERGRKEMECILGRHGG